MFERTGSIMSGPGKLRRVLVDTDPVFTQVRHLTDAASRETARQHTAFFPFGENIGSDIGRIPDDRLNWLPTRQPVVVDAWPLTPGPRDGKFTTVCSGTAISQDRTMAWNTG